MRAALLWVRADLRARVGHAAAIVLVVAGVVTALLLSATLLEGATNPWRALFAQTRGAHVWLHLTPGTPVRPLREMAVVAGVAGPYRATAATLVRGPLTAPVQLWAMTPALPAIGRPLVRQGHWLAQAQPGGVVLETSFAQALRAGVGSRLVVEGLDGRSVPVRVAGVADTSAQGFYPAQTPGLIWVLPALVSQVEQVAAHTEEVVGLRLSDPSATGFVVQQAFTTLGSGAVVSVSTWRDVQQSMGGSEPLLGLLLALFGLVALGGALLAIGNAAGGRVLVQRQDLAMLKTLGFTPRQLVAVVVAEHGALGLAGAGAGVLAARLLTAKLLGGVPVGVLPAVAPLPAGWVLLIAGGTEAAVLAATVVPAVRAGSVWPVAAVRPPPPGGRLSMLARTALITRLPPALVLGARAAFTRRVPAALTIGGLALPMVMATIGMGFWATLDSVQRHPGEIGLAAALTVSPGELAPAQAGQILHHDPDIAAVYPSVVISALLPGQTSAISMLGVGSSARPYPFHVAAGRLYHVPGEAVASQGLLDATHLRVGERIRIWVGAAPVIFTIVGRIIEPEYGGQVLAYGIDTLTQAGAVPPPASYSVVLRRGVSAAAAASRLQRASGGRLDVAQPVDPAAALGIIRPMLTGLFVVLGLIALTSLLTASSVGTGDYLRDVGALRAMGLTPRQIMACLMTRMGVLALIASAVGVALGVALSSHLTDLASQAFGIGAGIAQPPSVAGMAAAAAIATTATALVAVVPGHRAARIPVAAMLRPY
ncbi:MAG TPA: FtsX-like permease family protein [Streptosporangiaceae bacterium]|nr:FtsX-like permease family protein [Streptosporangiaceae bacterium]